MRDGCEMDTRVRDVVLYPPDESFPGDEITLSSDGIVPATKDYVLPYQLWSRKEIR